MKKLLLFFIAISLSSKASAFCGTVLCSYSQVKVESCSSSEDVSRKKAIELDYNEREIDEVVSSTQYFSLARVTMISDVEIIYWYKDKMRHHFKGAVTPYEKMPKAEFMLLGHNLESCREHFENKEMLVVIGEGFSCDRHVVINNGKETRSRCIIDFDPMYRFERKFEDLQSIGIAFPEKDH